LRLKRSQNTPRATGRTPGRAAPRESAYLPRLRVNSGAHVRHAKSAVVNLFSVQRENEISTFVHTRPPQRGLNQGKSFTGFIDSKVLKVVWVRAQLTAQAAQTLERVARGAVFLEDHNGVLKPLGVRQEPTQAKRVRPNSSQRALSGSSVGRESPFSVNYLIG
jgi:hypothetical protein